MKRIRAYLERSDPRAASRIARRLIEAGDGVASCELTTAAPFIIRSAVHGRTVTIPRVQHGAAARIDQSRLSSAGRRQIAQEPALP